MFFKCLTESPWLLHGLMLQNWYVSQKNLRIQLSNQKMKNPTPTPKATGWCTNNLPQRCFYYNVQNRCFLLHGARTRDWTRGQSNRYLLSNIIFWHMFGDFTCSLVIRYYYMTYCVLYDEFIQSGSIFRKVNQPRYFIVEALDL